MERLNSYRENRKYLHSPFILFVFRLFILLLFFLSGSCSKNSNDLQPQNSTSLYCGRLDWKNTLGSSGYFQGSLLNGNYYLDTVNYKGYNDDKTVVLHHESNNHILNNNPYFAFTYNQDKIIKIVSGETNSNSTFNFDNLGQLTTISITNTDGQGTTTSLFTYTYDSNEDPVKIKGHIENVSISGTSKADYDITCDYLTNNPNILPFSPELTPYSILFAYSFYLSKHLINKWQIHITGTDEKGVAIPTIDFTQQYTYTYDSDGHVATMVHTGNSKNIYKFTSSQCP